LLFRKIKDKTPKPPEVEIPKNPIDEGMISEIKQVIEDYIPPFIQDYKEKMQELVREKYNKIAKLKMEQEKEKKEKEEETDDEKMKEIQVTIEALEVEISGRIVELEHDNLNVETLKELGMDHIKGAITKVIMGAVGHQIEEKLPSKEPIREKAMKLAEKAIEKIVDEAVFRIEDQISSMIAKVLVEEKEVAEAVEAIVEEVTEIVDEVTEFVEEVSEEVEVSEEFVEEKVIDVVEEVTEVVETVVTEPVAESVEDVVDFVEAVVFEPTIEAVVEPVEEIKHEVFEDSVIDVVEERVVNLVKIKNDILDATLTKYRSRIEAKLPFDVQAQEKALELFRQRIEEIVDEVIARKTK